MTPLDLAKRDLKKAHMNLERAKQKHGVTEEELSHLQELLTLRTDIVAKLTDEATLMKGLFDKTTNESTESNT